nr:MCP four helix bundle domain-containing protein [uncultured Desulfobacter sp.]
MKIRFQLILSLIIFILCTGIVGIVGMRYIAATNRAFKEVADTDIPSITSLLEIKALSRQISIKSIEYSLRGDPRDKEKTLESIENLKKQLELIEDTITRESFLIISDNVSLFLKNINEYIRFSEREPVLLLLEKQKFVHGARKELIHYIDGLNQINNEGELLQLSYIKSESRRASIKVLEYYIRGAEDDKSKAKDAITILKNIRGNFTVTSRLAPLIVQNIIKRLDSFIFESEKYLQNITHTGNPLNKIVLLQSEVHKSRKELIHSLYPSIKTEKQELSDAVKETEKTIKNSINSLIYSIIIISLGAIILGILISRLIVNKIEIIKEAAAVFVKKVVASSAFFVKFLGINFHCCFYPYPKKFVAPFQDKSRKKSVPPRGSLPFFS